MNKSVSRFLLLLLLAGMCTLIILNLSASEKHPTVSSSCNSSCSVKPGIFEVKGGTRAISFKIVQLKPGRCCGDGKKMAPAGFSIKSDGKIIFTYYVTANETVSDPVPIDQLMLDSGRYEILSSVATGSYVKLSMEVVPVS